MARLWVLLLVACQGVPTDDRARSVTAVEASSEKVRDEARLLLEEHCGECHIAGFPTAQPGALRVFDLMEVDWPARMTEAQLRNAAWRLGEPIDEHARPRAVPADARATFARFVDAELARRRAL